MTNQSKYNFNVFIIIYEIFVNSINMLSDCSLSYNHTTHALDQDIQSNKKTLGTFLPNFIQ